jgi:dTDP-4-amino-4,6-dideoxygalactose transaminase
MTTHHVAHDWRVPFMRPDLPAYDQVSDSIRDTFTSGVLTKGRALELLEADAAQCVGALDAVGVSSCTTGLMLVLQALEPLRKRRTACDAPPCGAVSGAGATRDEVIVPSFIFLAAPAAIVWAGLRPVFVDVDPSTYTIDPRCVEKAFSPRTAAVLACHTFGCPSDIGALTSIAEPTGVPVIIDAAHGFGASRNGRQVGREGLAQVFSMSPTKLVVAGEGGVVTTSCRCLAELIRTAREYGNDGHYDCQIAGVNGRLPEISAIVGRASLARLPEVAKQRSAAAEAYRDVLRDVPGVTLQEIPQRCSSSWKDFCIGIDPVVTGITRDALREALAIRGIDTRAYYSPACHAMPAFRRYAQPGPSLPVTDRLAASLVALPMGKHVSPHTALLVAEEVRSIVSGRRGGADGGRD